MKRINGGAKAAGGYYWNLRTWGISTIEGESGVLDGTAQDRFVRVPMLVMVPLALVLSFVFVVFLPFIGFAMLAHAVVLKVLGLREAAARSVAATLAPSLQPGAAYFTGKPGAQEPAGARAPAPLAGLEAELDAARSATAGTPPESEK